MNIDDEVRAARFTGRFAFHDDPRVLERLERAAAASGMSASAAARAAIRLWLAEHESVRVA